MLSAISRPVESNTIECSKTLSCHGTWLSFLIHLALSAPSRNPLPELGVGSIPAWREAVGELRLVFTQLLKAFLPRSIFCVPDETNTIECSKTLSCHGTWLSFLIQLVVMAKCLRRHHMLDWKSRKNPHFFTLLIFGDKLFRKSHNTLPLWQVRDVWRGS